MEHGQKIKCVVCGEESTIFLDKSSDFAYCPLCEFPIRIESSIPLGDATLEKFIDRCKYRMVICFWAPFNRESEETLIRLDMDVEKAHLNKTVLISVDISRNPEMGRRFGIEVLPTIIIMENHREDNRVIGGVRQFDIDRLINSGSI